MKKTLKHFLISIFAVLSGVSVAYAGFVFPSAGNASKSSEINLSTPGWESLKQKGNTLVSISGGSNQSFALTSLGEVYAWGSDGNGRLGNGSRGAQDSPDDITAQFAGLSPNERIVSINTGAGMHAFALTSLGKVFGWGSRNYGQVGSGSSDNDLYVPAESPINITAKFAGLSSNEIVTCIATGDRHSLAVTSLGKVFTWGGDDYGQQGNGDTITSNVTTPTNITANFGGLVAGETITYVTSGSFHSFALTSLGKVFAWGRNNYGQVGNGSTGNITSPLNITSNFLGLSTNEQITSISSLFDHSYAVTSLGKVFVWGYGWATLGDGQNNAITGDIKSPKDITFNFPGLSTNEKVISVSAGRSHSLAVTSLGKVFGWGSRNSGQVGDGSTFQKVLSPTNITSNFVGLITNEIVTSISAAGDSSHAITSLGKFYSWGKDDYGQVGNGSTTGNITTPSNITNNFMWATTNEKVVSVVAGTGHSIAITSLGKVFTWGRNGGKGILGNGSSSSATVSTPTAITANFLGLETNEKVISVSAGMDHSLAVTSLGKVFAWGRNEEGQLGKGNRYDYATSPVDITANFAGLVTNEIVISVSANEYHSRAFTSLGKVFTWGEGTNGVLGTNDPNNIYLLLPTEITANFSGLASNEKVISMSGGYVSVLAITNLGKVYAWGSDEYGQLGDGTGRTYANVPMEITTNFTGLLTNEKVILVSAEYRTVFALTTLGKVYAWGYGPNGRLGAGAGYVNSKVESPLNITSNFGGLITNERVSLLIGDSLAVTTLGKVFTWGRNQNGQLGNGTSSYYEYVHTPTEVTTTGFSGLSANEVIISIDTNYDYYSLVSTNLGKTFAWGGNTDGQLGNGTSGQNVLIPENITANFSL